MIYVANAFYADTDSLYHHGILGMKWGIRRYQNKDGSLTEAGKRRLAKLESRRSSYERKINQLSPGKFDESNQSTQTSSSKKSSSNPHKGKSVFSMSDDELNREIARLGLEKKYNDYMKELYPEAKKKRSIGKAFLDDVVKPSLVDVGKEVTKNSLGMGANKIAKELGLEGKLYNAKKGDQNQGQGQGQGQNQRDSSGNSDQTRLQRKNERMRQQLENIRLQEQLQRERERQRQQRRR